MPTRKRKHLKRQRGGFLKSIKNYINSRASALYNSSSAKKMNQMYPIASSSYSPNDPNKSSLAQLQQPFKLSVDEHNENTCLNDPNTVKSMTDKQKSCNSWFNFSASTDPACKELKRLEGTPTVCKEQNTPTQVGGRRRHNKTKTHKRNHKLVRKTHRRFH